MEQDIGQDEPAVPPDSAEPFVTEEVSMTDEPNAAGELDVTGRADEADERGEFAEASGASAVEAAGAEAAGTEAAGTEAAGTEAAGTEAAGTEAAGTAAGPVTGESRVDAALERLGGLDDLAVSEHPRVYERIHGQLVEVLGELHSGPAG